MWDIGPEVDAMVIQAIRDNIPKWITGVILALLVVPFALWGIDSYFTASTDNSVATVNGDSIKSGDYQQAYQSQYQRMQQMYGQAFRPELIDEKALHEQTLQMLINQSLIDQQIAKDHYVTGDAQLVDAIQKNPSFQSDGKFNEAAYKATLTSIGMTPDEFERRMRQSIVTGQFQSAITDSAIATSAELSAAMA
ncbi:MAG TPA: SurA N-terminal domain-containing protein, partial [Gammaproteobacteria bacterium]